MEKKSKAVNTLKYKVIIEMENEYCTRTEAMKKVNEIIDICKSVRIEKLHPPYKRRT